jgi:hypothetical protein
MKTTTNTQHRREVTTMTTKFTTPLSPYKFAEATGKRPQMVYNYIKNRLIKANVTETGKMVLSVDEMTKWATKWAEKAAAKEATP